jgi:hypothetical protein
MYNGILLCYVIFSLEFLWWIIIPSIFTCLLDIYLPWNNVYSDPFIFKLGYLYFLLLSSNSSLYISDISPLLDMISKYFPPFCGLSFQLFGEGVVCFVLLCVCWESNPGHCMLLSMPELLPQHPFSFLLVSFEAQKF